LYIQSLCTLQINVYIHTIENIVREDRQMRYFRAKKWLYVAMWLLGCSEWLLTTLQVLTSTSQKSQ